MQYHAPQSGGKARGTEPCKLWTLFTNFCVFTYISAPNQISEQNSPPPVLCGAPLLERLSAPGRSNLVTIIRRVNGTVARSPKANRNSKRQDEKITIIIIIAEN